MAGVEPTTIGTEQSAGNWIGSGLTVQAVWMTELSAPSAVMCRLLPWTVTVAQTGTKFWNGGWVSAGVAFWKPWLTGVGVRSTCATKTWLFRVKETNFVL